MFDIKGYIEAENLEQAKTYLANNENAKIIAGGSDILVKLREGWWDDASLVGISRIGLDQISIDDDGAIHIGPMCTFTNIEKNAIIKEKIPYLGGAVGTIGGPQLRNVATIGGNVCNGATSADSASTLFCLDAKLKIESATQTKMMDIEDFYLGPSKVDLKQGEILTDIIIEKASYDGYKGKYQKFAQREAMDIATIGCAIMVKASGDVIKDVKIACGVAAPTPVRCKDAENFIKGKKATVENIDQAAALTIQNTKARDSWRGSKAFREHLVIELTKRGIGELCGLEMGQE
jgi:xanthine dehydrogenase FAD-binding subunit